MAQKDYSEDLLIQVPTAELLEQLLGWESLFAQDEEGFRPDTLLGRNADAEAMLSHDLLLPKLMSGQVDVSDIPLPEETAT